VLADGGALWLNLGNTYAASGKGGGGNRGDRFAWQTVRERKGFRMPPSGFKRKDLVLVACLVAEALRKDGWFLRASLVWRKSSAPEPKRHDRPSVSHESLFLLSKSEQSFVHDVGEAWWNHSVWDIRTDARAEHPAAYPEELVRRCILAGSTKGDTVLDPFCGSGTTGAVALKHGRCFIGIELNPEYVAMAERRVAEATRQGRLF
jgi:site-specific DNA-methyltransferase (adenine-specific)